MGYERLAPHYGWLERLVFRGAMQRCRTALVHELPTSGRILLLGEGRGALLRVLLRDRPGVDVEVFDASERMLAVARRRVPAGDAGRVQWTVGDVLSVAPQHSSYDGIVCCFFLDSFAGEELQRVLARIDSWLAPSAVLLVSDFRQAERGLAALRSRVWLRLLYASFRAATGLDVGRLEDPRPWLEALGFEAQRELRIAAGLMWARSFAKPGQERLRTVPAPVTFAP